MFAHKTIQFYTFPIPCRIAEVIFSSLLGSLLFISIVLFLIFLASLGRLQQISKQFCREKLSTTDKYIWFPCHAYTCCHCLQRVAKIPKGCFHVSWLEEISFKNECKCCIYLSSPLYSQFYGYNLLCFPRKILNTTSP